MTTDYEALGLKAGIEIHQQMDTDEKLFCGCPTLMRDISETTQEFYRYLRPTPSEMGETDRAAMEEVKHIRRFRYKAYDTTCLVENDEEPPRRINQEAVDIALEMGLLLNARMVSELHTMRKVVIDGSNTTGFQRTALVGTDGRIDSSLGPVGITVLCLEEEAAQKISEDGDEVTYSLDRLSIPLVEIGTDASIKTPQHAREVAEYLGMILRSTGKVKRGLGTIRQDINVSIAEGARVEIKGVQRLTLIERVVEIEAMRQKKLVEIKNALLERKAEVNTTIFDVSDVFADTGCKVIKGALKNGVVLAVLLKEFNGLVGMEIQPGRTFGAELSDRAKKHGVGGIFHTDELPGYGITQEEVDKLRESLNAAQQDCVVIVADQQDRAESALGAVIQRAQEAMQSVPEETRRAMPDGTSAYMRPLPGAARMYPETDVPPVKITQNRLDNIELPELRSERQERYMREYDLNEELAGLMASSVNFDLFERIMQEAKPLATLTVTTLEEFSGRENISGRDVIDVLRLVWGSVIAKEGVPMVLEELNSLREMGDQPDITAEKVAEQLGLTAPDVEDAEKIISDIVQSKTDFIQEQGEHAIGPLMGIVMKELRGKVDGQTASEILKEKIQEILNNS